MDELRRQTSSEGMSLEDLFLKLTGGHQTVRLGAVLDGWTASGRIQPGVWDDPHSQVAGERSRACARSGSRGRSSFLLALTGIASGRRCSGVAWAGAPLHPE